MTELITQELTDRDFAKKVAVMYVASFANQPHEPGVMLGQVRDFLIGKPRAVVEQVCNPSSGAVTKSDRPCLKSLHKWFEDWTGTKRAQPLKFRETPPDPPEDPPEVKDAAVAKWRTLRGERSAPSMKQPVSLLSDEQNEKLAAYIADPANP